jgi:hypothetical protein
VIPIERLQEALEDNISILIFSGIGFDDEDLHATIDLLQQYLCSAGSSLDEANVLVVLGH